jgi:hypothetical protein
MNLIKYTQQENFLNLIDIYKAHKNILYQEIYQLNSYDQILNKHGAYLVWNTKQKLENLLYIGCAGKIKSQNSITKQTIKQRIKEGHSPRRFSIKNNFFGLHPLADYNVEKKYKNKVDKIDKEKIKDQIEIYKYKYNLSQIFIEIFYFEDVFKSFSPKFVERTLLDTFYRDSLSLPLGNSQ